MAYVDDYTRAFADTYVSHDMLAKNNKLLAILMMKGMPSQYNGGSQGIANVFYKQNATQVEVNNVAYNQTAIESLDQATYQLARIQNSIVINGFDEEFE